MRVPSIAIITTMLKDLPLILICLLPFPLMAQTGFDLQGHRGCRALMPENSLPGFLKAVELGVNTLEMDVVISRDEQIVVSHEPWMSHVICSHPDGRPVTKKEEKHHNLFEMTMADIQKYDCGMRHHPDFPHQLKVPAVKPTLKMVVRSVERFAQQQQYPQPRYNIELKSSRKGDRQWHPVPDRFVELVVTEIRRLGIEELTTLQSFDTRILESLHTVPDRIFKISFLVEKGKNANTHFRKLSFTPDILSPHYKLVSPGMVETCHAKGILIIPWTVNTHEDAERLKSMGVNGLITDVIIF